MFYIKAIFIIFGLLSDLLCSLMIVVRCCRHRGPGFDSQLYQIFRVVVGLERGPLSIASINEELFEKKVAAAV
jgi:hypothetical protein